MRYCTASPTRATAGATGRSSSLTTEMLEKSSVVGTALDVAESGPPGVVYATFATLRGDAVPSRRARNVTVPASLPVTVASVTVTRRAAALNEPASSPVASVRDAPFSVMLAGTYTAPAGRTSLIATFVAVAPPRPW